MKNNKTFGEDNVTIKMLRYRENATQPSKFIISNNFQSNRNIRTPTSRQNFPQPSKPSFPNSQSQQSFRNNFQQYQPRRNLSTISIRTIKNFSKFNEHLETQVSYTKQVFIRVDKIRKLLILIQHIKICSEIISWMTDSQEISSAKIYIILTVNN